MTGLILALLAISLSVVAYQDFRWRAIHWITLPLLFILLVVKASAVLPLKDIALNLALIVGFLLIQLLGLTLYFSLKERKPVNIIDKYLGLGDVLFFVAIAAGFSFLNYILFYIASFIFIALLYAVLLTARNQRKNIPLAGGMALCLLVCLALEYITGIRLFYNEQLLLSLVAL